MDSSKYTTLELTTVLSHPGKTHSNKEPADNRMIRCLRNVLPLTGMLSFFSLIVPRTAHAYIDAGTGSYFIQVIIGVLFAASVMVRIHWGKFRIFCRSLFSRERRSVMGKENDGKGK